MAQLALCSLPHCLLRPIGSGPTLAEMDLRRCSSFLPSSPRPWHGWWGADYSREPASPRETFSTRTSAAPFHDPHLSYLSAIASAESRITWFGSQTASL